MALVRWDPFRDLTALQSEVNRLFSRATGGTGDRESWTPAIDVVENDDAIVVKAELAGMDPKDINIEVQDNVLTLSGERRFEDEVKEEKFYRIERRYGSFSRSLALPPTADETKVEAKYENGLLQITVPKTEIAKPKKITVTVGGQEQKAVEATGTETQS